MDYAQGSDDNDGRIASPFKTLLKAMQAARRWGNPSTIVLRNGTHYVNETIQFTADDSGLVIQNYPGETPILNAGALLDVTWQPYGLSSECAYLAIVFQDFLVFDLASFHSTLLHTSPISTYICRQLHTAHTRHGATDFRSQWGVRPHCHARKDCCLCFGPHQFLAFSMFHHLFCS